jgi:forkhead box protein K
VERSAGERGKGFYWTVEADCERMFEEQEARAATSAATGGKDSKVGGRKGKTAGALEPPLKRSVRGEPKGTPLPPPLTSTPLVFKKEAVPQPASGSASESTVKVETPGAPQQIASTGPLRSHDRANAAQPTSTPLISTSTQATSGTSHVEPSSAAPSVSSIPAIPASVILPIIVGPVPASHPSASSSDAQGTNSAMPHLSTPPIVLHENQLILNPTIFSHLTPAQLRELEALGAQKALEILQGHIVRFLKERIKTEGRARGRGRGKRARGAGPSHADVQAERKEKPPQSTVLFTATPLPTRSVPPPMDALLPTPSPSASDTQAEAEASPSSPIVVVDDDEPSDCPAPKRRRLEVEDVPVTAVAV